MLRSTLGGALVIAGPLLALFAPRAALTGASIAMALALTPVVLAVVEAATHHSGESLPGRLWPGLAAVAGLLLLLSEPSLANPWTDVLLAAIPVLTGCGAALVCSAQESPMRMPLALFGAAGAFGLAVLMRAAAQQGIASPDSHGLAMGLDALEGFLCVLALGRLSAARWSSQFVLVPLLVLVQGAVLLRGALAGRVVVGLLLLVVAGVALLVPPSEEAQFALGVPRGEPRGSD
ncbi:MAG TPA: hypothetical protein VLI45_00380 [Acidobacteriaceae bacterium]|nr:hypothetical protein [Acidobacteriaceae bacterium]